MLQNCLNLTIFKSECDVFNTLNNCETQNLHYIMCQYVIYNLKDRQFTLK